ncbi:MAG: carbonic anhydrase family protein [Halopseudomonas aestusnigri]
MMNEVVIKRSKLSIFCTNIVLSALAFGLIGGIFSEQAWTSEWTYSGEKGPKNWTEISPETIACGGSQQSPIAINSATAVKVNSQNLLLKWKPFHPFVMDNGHSIGAMVNGLGGYALFDETRYNLVQFHFHHGSEHTVDNKRYQAEAHFVHQSKIGDLMVVGVFIEEGESNSLIEKMWTSLPEGKGSKEMPYTISLHDLLPEDNSYYRYQGSLTTPGCFEIVTWHILEQPVTMSKRQIAAMANRYENNYRPTQSINRRYVLKGGE